MNVLCELTILAHKIKDAYPKLPEKRDLSDYKEKVRRSVIGDIQSSFAEIYGIIEREISDDSLDLTYTEALAKYPERIKSILELISILALSIKTKLNINDSEKVFDKQFIEEINTVSFVCYKLKLILSGDNDPNVTSTYNKGVVSKLEYTDYKTGFRKSICPGFIKGQIQGFYQCTPEEQTRYVSMITNIRERLDQNYKAPSMQDRVLISFSSNPSQMPLIPVELRQPKSLQQLTVNVLKKNYSKLFKQSILLPENITDKFPELNINYKLTLINKVKKIIGGITFNPSESEKKYIALLLKALEDKNPYNALHLVIQKIDKTNKTAFLSTFKDNMQPVRNEIVKLMKKYNVGKDEYIKNMGEVYSQKI